MRRHFFNRTICYLTFLLLSSAFAVGLVSWQNKVETNITPVILVDFKQDGVEMPYDYACDTCIISSGYRLDTFIVKIRTPSDCHFDDLGFVKVFGDTLDLYIGDEPDSVGTVIRYNEKTHEYDTLFIGYISYKMILGLPSQCIGTFTFKLLGIKDSRTVLKFNGKELGICINKKVSFEMRGKDTVNFIDHLGLKQGKWIETFESGKIKKEDTYINGNFQIGYEFNKKGDTISGHFGHGCGGEIMVFPPY